MLRSGQSRRTHDNTSDLLWDFNHNSNWVQTINNNYNNRTNPVRSPTTKSLTLYQHNRRDGQCNAAMAEDGWGLRNQMPNLLLSTTTTRCYVATDFVFWSCLSLWQLQFSVGIPKYWVFFLYDKSLASIYVGYQPYWSISGFCTFWNSWWSVFSQSVGSGWGVPPFFFIIEFDHGCWLHDFNYGGRDFIF